MTTMTFRHGLALGFMAGALGGIGLCVLGVIALEVTK